MKIEVGDKVELNNGEVHGVERMYGDCPCRVDPYGFGPFVIDSLLYHEDGRVADSGPNNTLSVKRILQKAPSDTLENLNVGPGDVVEYDGTRGGEVQRYIIGGWVDGKCYHTGQSLGGAFDMDPGPCWRLVRRSVNRDLLHGAEGFGEKIEFWDSLWEERPEGPTLWRDMTNEEKANVPDDVFNDPANPLRIPWNEWSRAAKGALLLADNEGRAIEYFNFFKGEWSKDPNFAPALPFLDTLTYRAKPEPVRETVTLMIDDGSMGGPQAIGTIDLEDGEPDCDSVKMEKVGLQNARRGGHGSAQGRD